MRKIEDLFDRIFIKTGDSEKNKYKDAGKTYSNITAQEMVRTYSDEIDFDIEKDSIWSNRRNVYAGAFLLAVIELRDNHGLILTAESLRKMISLSIWENISIDKRISEKARFNLSGILSEIPGYTAGQPHAKFENEQFGFSTHEFCRFLEDSVKESLKRFEGMMSKGAFDIDDIVEFIKKNEDEQRVNSKGLLTAVSNSGFRVSEITRKLPRSIRAKVLETELGL